MAKLNFSFGSRESRPEQASHYAAQRSATSPNSPVTLRNPINHSSARIANTPLIPLGNRFPFDLHFCCRIVGSAERRGRIVYKQKSEHFRSVFAVIHLSRHTRFGFCIVFSSAARKWKLQRRPNGRVGNKKNDPSPSASVIVFPSECENKQN